MPDHSALAPIQLEDPTPFLIADNERIEHLLGRLTKRPELVCLYPATRREHFALSALLHITDQYLIFDASPDLRTNKILLDSPFLTCVSGLDRVHIQFDAPHAQRIDYQGQPAIRAEHPASLLFVQRRDYFRLTIPARQPVRCRIPLGDTGSFIDTEVADISMGGLGLLGPLPHLVPLPGMRLSGCQVELPEVGSILVDLLVCTTRDISPRSGNRTLRIGCRFLQLSGASQTLAQRYINRVERSRITHE